MGLLTVFTVIAGVLAMHAVSSHHNSHVVSSHDVMSVDTQPGDAHVHTGDHHQDDTSLLSENSQPQIADGARPADATTGPTSIVAHLSTRSSGAQTAAGVAFGATEDLRRQGPEVTDAVLMRPGQAHAEQGAESGHELCPEWIPGHCPAVPVGTPMCQAVLSGAGVMLLLLMLSMLALASRGKTWVLALRPAPVAAGHGPWRARQQRLQTGGPSLLELCISRT